MPQLPGIPGYYYDNEKKKYFKITAAHTNTSNSYNADRVRKEREEAEEAEAQRKEQEAQQPHLKRRRRISDSSNGLFNYRLRMQMGLVKLEAPRRDADADIWATVLEEDELFRASTDKLISGMEVIPGLGDVFTFAPNQGVGWHPHTLDHYYRVTHAAGNVQLPKLENRMVSSTIIPGRNAVMVAAGNSYFEAEITIPAEDPTDRRPKVDKVHQIAEAGTLWSCATFAAGITAFGGSAKSGQKGLLRLTSTYAGPITIRPESDVLALEYLDRNVLLTGSRNGKINIYDSRRNLEKEITHETALASHKSSIINMKKLRNDNYFIVNGLGGETQLHDLRYCRPIEGHQRGQMKKKGSTTQPVMTYRNYNKSSLGLGFDVDESQELMALAGEDKKVRLYSISSGRVIKTLEFKDEVSSLRFSRDPVDGLRDLYVAGGPWVYRYHTGLRHDEIVSDDDEDVEMSD